MSDIQELINKRLQAEAGKLRAEAKKLKAEEVEINSRVESAKIGKRTNENFRVWVNIGIAIVAIVSGVTTIWIKSDSFLSQKAKASKFSVNHEIIELAEKLSTGEEQHERDLAAVLLSNYEEDAIPILIWNLNRETDPDATIKALKLIKKKLKTDSNKIINMIYSSANKVFAKVEPDSEIEYEPISNHLKALEAFGNDLDVKKTITGVRVAMMNPRMKVVRHINYDGKRINTKLSKINITNLVLKLQKDISKLPETVIDTTERDELLAEIAHTLEY